MLFQDFFYIGERCRTESNDRYKSSANVGAAKVFPKINKTDSKQMENAISLSTCNIPYVESARLQRRVFVLYLWLQLFINYKSRSFTHSIQFLGSRVKQQKGRFPTNEELHKHDIWHFYFTFKRNIL